MILIKDVPANPTLLFQLLLRLMLVPNLSNYINMSGWVRNPFARTLNLLIKRLDAAEVFPLEKLSFLRHAQKRGSQRHARTRDALPRSVGMGALVGTGPRRGRDR